MSVKARQLLEGTLTGYPADMLQVMRDAFEKAANERTRAGWGFVDGSRCSAGAAED